MEKENKKSAIFGKIGIILSIIIVIFLSGYFVLDKLIIPHYFKDYGINGIGDMVGVINSLYKNPKEEHMITNGYSNEDLEKALNKLRESNYHIDDDGNIISEDFKLNAETVELTDREFAAVCNKFLKDEILEDSLNHLNYIKLSKLSILEINIDLSNSQINNGIYNSAKISFIAKLDTAEMINQIEEQMETPKTLLKMIIPGTLYFSVNYEIDLNNEADERVSNGSIAINGRSEKESDILMNMLVDFIFPPDAEMNLHKFIVEFGNVLLEGIDELGDFKFKIVDNRNGFMISPQG